MSAGLTPEQLQAWHRDGYIAVQGLYDGATMLQWKQILRDVMDEDRRAAGLDENAYVTSGVRVWMCDALHPVLREAMRDDKVTPILKQIIGPDVEFLSAKAVFKDARVDMPSPWHQDWFYWEGATKMSIWIALDDASVDNGCLKFVPGTQHKVFEKSVVNENAFVNRITDDQLASWPQNTLEVKRGDAVFFHDLAVHSSHPNTAKRDRWSLISTYRSGAVKDEATVWPRAMTVCGKSVNGAVKLEELAHA